MGLSDLWNRLVRGDKTERVEEELRDKGSEQPAAVEDYEGMKDDTAIDELEPAWDEGTRSEPYGKDEEVVRQLSANHRLVVGARAARLFAARVDGEIASFCDLYSKGDIGQIEAVMTREQFSNRGLARATVLAALAASREAGHDLTFLLADRDDWPKELYRKLGFDEIGQAYEFIRPAA